MEGPIQINIANNQPEAFTSSENSSDINKVEIMDKDDPENDEELTNYDNEDQDASDEKSITSERSESDERDEHSEDGSSNSEISEDDNIGEENGAIQEREEGDGQESAPSRKVDDDEDKRNPQYIPKRGTFYEHDDRTATEEEADANQAGSTVEKEKSGGEVDDGATSGKKKVWKEKENSRWNHDKYNDDEQAPKSRQELVSVYGYDIRNEDGPPRARRRRRYGRGPNKYTRKWEDEDAYGKTGATTPSKLVRPRKSRGRNEEFPPLNSSDNLSQASSENQRPQDPVHQNQAVSQPTHKTVPNRDVPHHNGNITDDRNKTWPNNDKRESNMKREIVNNNFKPGPKQINQINNVSQNDMQNIQEMSSPPVRIVKPTRSISGGGGDDMVRGRGITRSRGWKSAGRPNPTPDTQKRKNISQAHDNGHEYIMSQNFINKNMNSSQQQAAPPIVEEVERGMSNMSVREPLSGRSGGHNRQTSSVPPRLQGQEAQRQVAPKRYSSLRQRSLPETAGMATGGAVPPQQQPPPAAASAFTPHPHPPPPTIIHYTPHEFAQQGGGSHVVSNGSQPLISAAGYAVAQYAQSPYAGTYMAAPAALPPAVAQPPPPGPPPPQIINYAPQPPQGPQVAPPVSAQFTPAVSDFAAYPHQQFAPVNQTQGGDVYHHQAQSQGGITYYSMQSQQVMQMQRVQTAKRPKAAIPIVPPPELKEPRGRGRLHSAPEDTASAPSVGADAAPTNVTPAYDTEPDAQQYTGDVIVQQ